MNSHSGQHGSDSNRQEDLDASADYVPTERDLWIHDFRNALGNTTIAASAVRDALERQRYQQADMLLRGIEEGCERCLRLLGTMPE